MAEEIFELTDLKKDLLFNNKEFRDIIAKVVFNANEEIIKSYQDMIIDRVCEEYNIDKTMFLSGYKSNSFCIPMAICLDIIENNKHIIKMPLEEVLSMFKRTKNTLYRSRDLIKKESKFDSKIVNLIRELNGLVAIKNKYQ